MEGTEQGNGEASGYHDPDAQTPGFSPRGDMDPAIGMERPMGGSSGGPSRSMERPMVRSPGGPFQMSPPISRYTNLDFLEKSGGRRAGNQPRELFGAAVAKRSIITPIALQNRVEGYQSMDEMKQVFIHQLAVEGGAIDVIRADHNETFAKSLNQS